MYPYLPALTGAREIRVPLAEGDVHDLEAMAAEVTRGDPAADRLQPEQPDRDPHPGRARSPPSASACPTHVTIVLDEAYVEFQTHDDPDATVDLLADFPNLVVLRTFSKVYGLAGLRVGYAIGSAEVPRRRRRRAPAVQRQRARPGGGGGGDPALRRRRPPGREHAGRAGAGRAAPRRARRRRLPRPRPTSPGSTSATPRRPRSSPASPSARSRSVPARRSATPATSASPTAPPPRTSASSPRSASCWAESFDYSRFTVLQPQSSESNGRHHEQPPRHRRRARLCPLLLLLAI